MSEDEHPNERLVTPSKDGEGFDRSLVSRRDILGGSALLAGLLAYTSDPTQPTNPNVGVARASHNPDEPLIILGPEDDPIGYLFQDTDGGVILQDATSGNHFWYNKSEGRWETDAEFDVPALTTEDLNTELAAGAGEIQSKIDEISDAGNRGTVVLEPQTVYDPSSTIRIKSGVTLDCRNALFNLSTDINLFEIERDARLIRPDVDFPSGYTSVGVAFKASFGTGYGQEDETALIGGSFVGDGQGGTGILLQDDADGDGVRGIHITDNPTVSDMDTGLDILANDTGGTLGFVNANRIRINLLYCTTNVLLRGDGDIVGNRIGATITSPNSGAEQSTYGIRLQNGDENEFDGAVMDLNNYSTGAVVIESGAGSDNLFFNAGPWWSGGVVDNKGDASNAFLAGGTFYGGANGPESMDNSIGVGHNSTMTGKLTAGFGYAFEVSANRAAAFGRSATASANSATAIGERATASGIRSFVIGNNRTVSDADAGYLGADQVYFGAVEGTVPDASLANNEMMFEIDNTNGELTAVMKDGSGTVRRFNVGTWTP